MIIRNEQHYRTTERLMREFQDCIENLQSNPPADMSSERVESECRVMQYQIDQFRAQLQEYDDIRAGKVDVQGLRAALTALYQAQDKCGHSLLAARMASGITVEELSERIGVSADELRALEANEYRPASLEMLGAVSEVLTAEMAAAL